MTGRFGGADREVLGKWAIFTALCAKQNLIFSALCESKALEALVNGCERQSHIKTDWEVLTPRQQGRKGAIQKLAIELLTFLRPLRTEKLTGKCRRWRCQPQGRDWLRAPRYRF